MGARRLVVTLVAVAGLLGVLAPVAGAAPGPGTAAPAAVTAVEGSTAVMPVMQTDWGSFLFGLLIQQVAHAVLAWGESIMNAAIAEGAGSLFAWQLGKSVWDLGCSWGRAGEALTPGLPPTFPTKCTLYPQWPY